MIHLFLFFYFIGSSLKYNFERVVFSSSNDQDLRLLVFVWTLISFFIDRTYCRYSFQTSILSIRHHNPHMWVPTQTQCGIDGEILFRSSSSWIIFLPIFKVKVRRGWGVDTHSEPIPIVFVI